MRKATSERPTTGTRPRGKSQRRVVTVLKADISGSTPLAERLDPEELRAILATYFATLTNHIQRHGGVVDKYIGDAVMAVFGLSDEQSDDAVRAAQAALGMVSAIARENEKLEARYGVRLSLRVGLNTGELAAPEDADIALFRELTSVAESMEAAAPLNTVLMSGATRAAIMEKIRSEPAGAVRLKGTEDTVLSFRPIADGADTTADRTSAVQRGDSASLQVAGHKEYVLHEERKIVTVLFADVVITGGRLRSEAIRPILNAYFGDVVREIQRYGGTIDKYIGDAVMAVFGAPVSHDDDAARAIGAGVGIQSALARRSPELEREYGVRLTARVGVNTGEVVAGLLPGEVVAYTVTGDAVNTAQRIESAAAPGDVIVSGPTRDLARHAFMYEAIAPLTLKGKAQPVPAFRVLQRERRAAPREGPPLVGRDAELARLRALLDSVVAGRGALAHLHGEPGVGKTRIVSELLNVVPKQTARLRARCASYESETPYALVADILRRLTSLAPTDDEEQARTALSRALALTSDEERPASMAVLLEVLGYPSTSSLTPEAKRRLIVAQLRAQLIRRAETGLVAVLEDLHWLDPASADALRAVLAGFENVACLVITTSREAEVPWQAEVIDLRPLGDESAASLIERLAPTMDDATRSQILDRTAGNPFFIEEVVHAMLSGVSATVPASVQDLLEARVDALDAAPRLVAQRASVIGRRFATRVLERIVDGDDLGGSLASLERERFVERREQRPEPMFAFRHALVQEVVYRTQLLSQRKRAHVSVGDAYAALYEGRLDEFVDVLAYHYGRGDDDPKALDWLGRAGDRARSLYANDEAIGYYRAALSRTGEKDGALAASFLERIGDVELVIGKYDEAVASFDSARGRVQPARGSVVARLHRKIAAVLRARGAYDDAFQALGDARAALGDAIDIESAWIDTLAGDLHFRRGDHVAAAEEIRRAVRIAEARGGDDVGAEALKFLGNIAVTTSKLEEAVRLYERSRETYERTGDDVGRAQVSSNIGTAYRRMGRYDDALVEYENSRALAGKAGHLYGVALAFNNIGALHVIRGAPVEAIEPYERAIRLLEEIGSRAEVAMAFMNLGEARVDAGDIPAARSDLSEAERRFSELGTTWYAPGLYRYVARAELAAGELDAARAAAEHSLELAVAQKRRLLEALAQRVLAEIALAVGERERARELLDRSSATLTKLGEADELARTETVRRRLA